ncbi:unnamed protein product, partial [Ilex paraguariensis]
AEEGAVGVAVREDLCGPFQEALAVLEEDSGRIPTSGFEESQTSIHDYSLRHLFGRLEFTHFVHTHILQIYNHFILAIIPPAAQPPSSGCQLVRTEGEGESNPAEDSTSITKLVGRQTIVKKRKATAE